MRNTVRKKLSLFQNRLTSFLQKHQILISRLKSFLQLQLRNRKNTNVLDITDTVHAYVVLMPHISY